MRYLISGEDLSRLLVVAARRLDADEMGAIVQRVYQQAEPSPEAVVDLEPAADGAERFPYAKPE